MDIEHLGDGQDIVKQTFLRWLSRSGKWAADPMFTSEVAPEQVAAFKNFLGVDLVTCRNFQDAHSKRNRCEYFRPARSCPHNLFLDPTTGVGARRGDRLTMEELCDIAQKRPQRLTMVYDQSFDRDGPCLKTQIEDKLDWLGKHGLYAFAYMSNKVNFLIVSSDFQTLRNAKGELLRSSRLPASRFVEQADLEI